MANIADPKPGQVWRERFPRQEYAGVRLLRILSVEEPTRFSHQAFARNYEINVIQYELSNPRPPQGYGLYYPAPRPMMVGGLKKNWELVHNV